MGRSRLSTILLGIFFLAGCAAPPSGSPLASPVPSAAPTTAPDLTPLALGDGVTLYDDLVYDRLEWAGSEHSLELDLYLPASRPSPVIVFIHGGGWTGGSRDPCPGDLFAAHGYATACIDYRLADPVAGCPPALSFPAQIEDVKAAVRWLRLRAQLFGLDPARFAAVGESAGGHLAVLLAVSAGQATLQGGGNLGPADTIQAAVDWYGPVDPRLGQDPAFDEDPCVFSVFLRSRRATADDPGRFELTLAWASLLGGSLADPDILARAELASPLSYLDSTDPPILILHGEADNVVPIDQSQALADALAEAGVDVTFARLPALGHNYARFGPPGQHVDPSFLDPTLDFLGRVLPAP